MDTPTTKLIDLRGALVHALSLSPNCYPTLMRIYNSNRPLFFSTAKKSSYRNTPEIKSGRGEHEILALRALGILEEGTEEQINLLLRSADRKLYDRIKAHQGDTIDPTRILEEYCREGLNSQQLSITMILLLGYCTLRGLKIDDTDITPMILQYLNIKKQAAMFKAGKLDNHDVRTVQSHLNITESMGITTMLDEMPESLRHEIDPFILTLHMEGIDVDAYTDGVRLTKHDSSLIAGDTPRDTAIAALILFLARAIRKDREFILELHREDNSAQLQSAKEAVTHAESALSAAEIRLEAMDREIVELRREISGLRRMEQEAKENAAELANLREAIYHGALAEGDSSIEPAITPTRNIDGLDIVIIGGHPTWARRMKELYPQLKTYPAGTTCPPNVLVSAHEVWIQASYMAHSDFYTAINVIRKADKSVRYFSGAGVSACVRDIERMGNG